MEGPERDYASQATPSVLEFLRVNVTSDRVLSHIERCFELIADFPSIGKAYEPSYAAARPPFSCRQFAVPDTPFTVYYVKDDERRLVTFFCVDFQRADPTLRFSADPW